MKNKAHTIVAKPARAYLRALPTLLLCWGVLVISAANYPIDATANMSTVEKNCFDDFHRYGGSEWRRAVRGQAADGPVDDIDLHKCNPFVSKDMKTWIGSEPDSSEAVGSEPINFVLKIVPNPSDGKVFLNGVYEGLGVVKLDLAQGNYLVEVIKDGFEPFEKDVELNKSIILEVAMNPIPAQTPEFQEEAKSNAEVIFWQTIKDSDDPAMFEEYLRQFPDGVGLFSGLAKLKLKGLENKNIPKTTSIPELDYGSYHALVIGNNSYRHLPDLKTAVADARRVSDILEELYGFEVSRLENANRTQILRLVSDLRKKISEKDNLLIYYAGHGHLDEGAGEGYWLPVDADPEDPSNWLMTDQIVGQIRAMSAKHVLIVSDSCFSGVLTRGIKIVEKTPSYIARMINSKARLALTSGGLEPVADSGGSGHSVFAAKFISLLEANRSVLDGTQLFSELRPEVMLNSDQTPEYGRIRKAGDAGGDFLFVRQ